MMRWLFLMLLVLHGFIHLMGVAKAFDFAELPALSQPISKGLGGLWLAAALAMLATALLLLTAPRLWWAAGLIAVVLSQAAIVSAWGDAKFGTLANVLVLAGVVYGFASEGPFSFRADCRRQVQPRLAHVDALPAVAEADLQPLPEPVQRYVRQSGAVGQPRVHHVRAVWRGRIRGGPDEAWMPFTAEQHNFIDEPARFFLMDATRSGVPVDVYHAFTKDAASMRVRLLSLVPLVNAGGDELRRAEVVTILNDLAILAPAALVDAARPLPILRAATRRDARDRTLASPRGRVRLHRTRAARAPHQRRLAMTLVRAVRRGQPEPVSSGGSGSASRNG